MRLRVAKKVHLGTACSGANCHRWSTVVEAYRLIWRAFTRKARKGAKVPRRLRATADFVGSEIFGDFSLGSRLLHAQGMYQLCPSVTVDWDWTPGYFVPPPPFSDPHGLGKR